MLAVLRPTVLPHRHPKLRNEQQSINYLKASMFTNLKIDVQQHFMQMLLRYINLRLDVRGQEQRLLPKSDQNRDRVVSF
jgi:hypothetical protein